MNMIALHEGHYFGVANLILCLLACAAIASSSKLGVVMWWRRRPKGSGLGVPAKPVNPKLQRGAAILIIVLAIRQSALRSALRSSWIGSSYNAFRSFVLGWDNALIYGILHSNFTNAKGNKGVTQVSGKRFSFVKDVTTTIHKKLDFTRSRELS